MPQEMKEIPNPGSDEAIGLGCICPIIDNHYGAGIPLPNGVRWFIYDFECPIHKFRQDNEKEEKEEEEEFKNV